MVYLVDAELLSKDEDTYQDNVDCKALHAVLVAKHPTVHFTLRMVKQAKEIIDSLR